MDERVGRLVARRDRLELLLGVEEDGSKAASLSRELRAMDAELAELAPSEVRSRVDDLSKRRQDRISGSEGVDSPAARKRGGRAGGDRTR